MKKLIYNLVRFLLKVLLHLYFGKIKINGLENIPKNKPVLLLSNHQNSFLDTILIGTACGRSPFFLTMAAVFKTKLLKTIFTFFRMIPVYRIRDGINSLKKNDKTFDKAVALLAKNESIVIFPEANHNLKRRVRPLSKGFTRILFMTLEKFPDLDIHLVPVGVNYVNPAKFPDKAAIFYGKPIRVQEIYNPNDLIKSKDAMVSIVSERLKLLTTHIESEKDYNQIIEKLDALGVNYLEPEAVNKSLLLLQNVTKIPTSKKGKNRFQKLLSIIFWLLNFPVLLLWQKVFKPKIKEIEFLSTMRFAFSVAIYPFYYLLLFIFGLFSSDVLTGLSIAGIIFFLNILFTKLILKNR